MGIKTKSLQNWVKTFIQPSSNCYKDLSASEGPQWSLKFKMKYTLVEIKVWNEITDRYII